nr:exo-polygalacturonase [uncultured bacterium]
MFRTMYIKDFEITRPIFGVAGYDILEYGAVGDGIFDNTEIIQGVIDECSREGGGRVIIPRGIFFSRPLELKSRVNLQLLDGSLLLFSDKLEDYPLIYTSFEGFFTYRCVSPLYAKDAEDIAITGSGIIDGNGGAWRPVKKFKVTEAYWNQLIKKGVVQKGKEEVWWPSQQALDGHLNLVPNPEKLKIKEECEKYHDFLRPVLLNLTRCKNVNLSGVTFQNSPAWCLHPWLCENVLVENISVKNPWFSQNGDGIDVESCKYVKVLHSKFDVGDDALCVKSGKNEDGRKLGVPCEYIQFRNCIVYHGHGGFVIGSEMSGGVRNVKVEDCLFIGTDTGLRFKSCLGRGGVVENIKINNISMTDIKKEAIIFTMGYDMDTKEGQEILPEEVPEFKEILISNINCMSAETAISISGLAAKPVHNIYLYDIDINSKKPAKFEYSNNIDQSRVRINLMEDTYGNS